jgi:hypothetical protein
MENRSDIQPEIIHSDSHGQSEPVFGLAYLLGIKLMPRIKNWKHLAFYRPHKNTRYQHIDALFSDHINWKLLAPPGMKEQVIEVAVFLFLIVPSMILSLFVVRQGGLSFVLTAVATILRDLGLVSLILFFLWRNGESVKRIGWNLRRAGREAALGAALFIPFVFEAALLERGLLRAGLSRPDSIFPGSERRLRIPIGRRSGGSRRPGGGDHLPRLFDAALPGSPAEFDVGRVALVRDLLPGARLQRVGRVGDRRRDGRGFRHHLSFAPKPCRSYRDALPPGLSQHCFAAVAGSEVKDADARRDYS